MKSFIQILTTVCVAMLISCCLNSVFMELGLMPKMAPGSIGTSVSGTKAAHTNPNRKDFMYGDFNVVDGQPRPSDYVAKVIDDDSDNQVEFPTSW